MVREKLREELYLKVPTPFRCPISMDVMKSPVSLCTGVTYDRASIQTWLSQGHNTCPATMQVLPSTDVTPNLTLRRLIQLWLLTADLTPTSASNSAIISKHQALNIITTSLTSDPKHSLPQIVRFAKFSDENKKFVALSSTFIPKIVEVLRSSDELEVCELVFSMLDVIVEEEGVKGQLNDLILKRNKGDSCLLSRFVLVLSKGKSSAKVQAAKVLESVATDSESQRRIAETEGVLRGLYELVAEQEEKDLYAVDVGLAALVKICSSSRQAKKELVRLKIVRTVGKILAAGAETEGEVIEKALKLLERIATCTEGRGEIGGDVECLTGVVKRLMKFSGEATEHGITVLWSVCCLARDARAQEAVMKLNGLTKVLLVMQSGCPAVVRQMCGELVKVLRVKSCNSKSCLASYETRTTHIMPY